MSEPMTKRDREQLAQVAKMRSRVAKASVEQREMVLRAQVAEELKALFDVEERAVSKAVGVAIAEAARYDKELQERLSEYEIPEHLRPHIVAEMMESQMAGKHRSLSMRRNELDRIASSRIKALGAAARVEVDRQCADTVERLITGGLSNEEAQKFLDEMPTIDQLMMAPPVAELESVHDEQRRQRRELGSEW